LRPARVVVSKRAIGAASAPDEDEANIHDAN
jgi:hypothetical protein